MDGRTLLDVPAFAIARRGHGRQQSVCVGAPPSEPAASHCTSLSVQGTQNERDELAGEHTCSVTATDWFALVRFCVLGAPPASWLCRVAATATDRSALTDALGGRK